MLPVQTKINGKVVLLVLVCHIIAISLLFISIEPKTEIKKPQKIAIQNIKLSAKQEKVITSQPLPIIEIKEEPLIKPDPSKESEETTKPQEILVLKDEPKEKPIPKKDEKKEVSKKIEPKKSEPKKTESKPLKEDKKKENKEVKTKAETAEKSLKTDQKKTTTKKEEPKIDPDLLKSIEANIAKVGKKTDKTSQKKELSVDLPKAISSLKTEVEGSDSIVDMAYEDELQLYLKSLLILPEFGDVKVKLTLKRNGKVTSVKIIKAESKKNKEYLEEALLKLKLPSFGKNFPGQEEKSFTLTLSNAV